MSAVPLKLQISEKNEKSASLGLRQVLCRLRGRYGKILLTAEPFSFFQLGSYRIGVGISGSHRLPKNRLPHSLEILRPYALRHRYWVYCIADSGVCQG